MSEGQEGFYSSTSGTYFADEAALKEHYQSDLHRYNLKRKVAGLPPVTKDWFDARKQQLTLTGGAADVHQVSKHSSAWPFNSWGTCFFSSACACMM